MINAMRARRKIEAIKLLRESTGMGLAEAKQAVEEFQQNDSAGAASTRPSRSETGLGRVILIILIIAAFYFGYKYLT